MRRLWLPLSLTVLSAISLGLLIGCNQGPPPLGVVTPQGNPDPAVRTVSLTDAPAFGDAPLPANEPTRQEKYDAALLDALNLIAEKKYEDALGSLLVARKLSETEVVRRQIDRVRELIKQQEAAAQTAEGIATVLKDGNAEEAARLASAAVRQFGATDAVEKLVPLKQQADALVVVAGGAGDDRRARFRADGDAALQEQNLRAALLAYDQALQLGDDPGLRRQADDLRGRVEKYDDLRRRAAELRRDRARVEEAVALLQEAAACWDTTQVRQDIEDYTLAQQHMRDRVGVADFEVRGDLGVPLAGRTIAEEILPGFRPRFDVVERGQIARLADELKLEAADLGVNDAGRREIGRLAGVRYLVLGSVNTLGGVSVNARLVEVRTGLVVQTAKVAAPTLDALVPLLPRVGRMLQMTDEEKFAFEAKQAQAAAVAVISAEPAAVPPPPEVLPPTAPPPPPVVVYTPRPPAVGAIVVEDFERLPVVVADAPPPPPTVVVVERERPVCRRMFQLNIELGDNLFRRGKYHEAHKQYELALQLSPGHVDVAVRIDRCRPYLPPPPPPPPPVLVVAPAPVVIVAAPPPRPRIAVMNFVVNADPSIAPPGMSDWAADQLASHFVPDYEVIDRGELFWYMGRLGLTVRDVLVDPTARVCLGRALNARFFVFGVVQQTASFNVKTHMVDVESGARQGLGDIHVQDHAELKLRLHELAKQTKAPPAERDAVRRESQESEQELANARRLLKDNKPGEAKAAAEAFLQRKPDHAGMRTVLQEADIRLRQEARNAELQREAERQRADAEAARRKQAELTRSVEAAKAAAAKEAAARSEADRKAKEEQKTQATARLNGQIRAALDHKDYPQAVALYRSALALAPTEENRRGLADAQALADAAAKQRAAEEQARRDAEAKQKHEAELAQARAAAEAERRKREADEQARRKAQEAADEAAYQKLVAQGKEQLAQGKTEAALAALHGAEHLRKTDEVTQLLAQAQEKTALEAAAKKSAAEKAAVEKRLVEEKAAREAAEAKARKAQDEYTEALKQAQQALAEKKYAQAQARFQDAGKLFRTDAVLSGLKQAEDGLAQEKAAELKKKQEDQARADAEKKKQAEEQQRAAALLRHLADGKAALEAKQFDRAAQAFGEARKLAPENADAVAGVERAEQGKRGAAAELARQKEQEETKAKAKKLVEAGQAGLAAKQYDQAAQHFREALQVRPNDPDATAGLQAAEKARASAEDAARAQAEAKKKADERQRLVREGQAALGQKKFDEAAAAFKKAQELEPGDPAVQQLLKETERARGDAAAELKKKQEEQAKAAQVRDLLGQAAGSLKNKDFAGASRSVEAAARLAPTDPEVVRARQDLQRAEEAARADAEAKQKRQAEFDAHLGAARQALAGKRYDEALKALTDAERVAPNSPDVANLRRAAEKAKADAAAAEKARADAAAAEKARADAEKAKADAAAAEKARAAAEEAKKKKDEEQKRQAEFTRHITEAQKAAAAKRFPDAVKEYEEALKLVPNDPAAAAGLKRAKENKP